MSTDAVRPQSLVAGRTAHLPPFDVAQAASGRPLTLLFALTLFTSASLVFIVEPMFGKLVLPRLGGAPSVWNTCMVFYQAVLLAGYAYAHLLSTRCSLRQQVVVHVALLTLTMLTLPVAVGATWTPPVDRSPIPSLLAALTTGVGLPLFVLSATAPLLQHWFTRTNTTAGRDPYFLYAASNVGSILALLAYPLVIEPSLSLTMQALRWNLGYGLLIALTLACGFSAWPGRPSAGAPSPAAAESRDRPTWRRRARWVALSLVPSSLMLAVTTYISTDVGSVPLLWTIPLALYLLSFIMAFGSRRLIPRKIATAAGLTAMLMLALALATGVRNPMWATLLLHLVSLFLLALLLHSELADDRPDTASLTEYYLWISIGGVAGGLCNTLIAPLLFTAVVEYPVALVAAAWLMAGRSNRVGSSRRFVAAGLACGLAAALLLYLVRVNMPPIAIAPPLAILVMGYLLATRNRTALTLAVGLIVLAGGLIRPADGELMYARRTFFGVVRVWNVAEHNQRRLAHGTTFHGAQNTAVERQKEPLAYYHRTGPIGRLLTTLSDRLDTARFGVVGLGAGGLAAYQRPGQQWTFYEIDPEVERIARDERFFTYLRDCGSACSVRLGDARVTLAREHDVHYDVLILDAFSSDAIPVHLMTREAMGVYLSRLAGDGLLVFHISNRHLSLSALVAGLAAEHGLVGRTARLTKSAPDLSYAASEWVVMTRHTDSLGALIDDPEWNLLVADAGTRVWTDDFSNILAVLKL